MSVIQDNSITTNSVKPADGQSLVLKKAGGTASITVATSGEATFAENIILTANKGLSFQNHSVSSATGASSTTSDNVLDDYEEGTVSNALIVNNSAITTNTGGTWIYEYSYTKIGRTVTVTYYIDTLGYDIGANGTIQILLPFTPSNGRIVNRVLNFFGSSWVDTINYTAKNEDRVYIYTSSMTNHFTTSDTERIFVSNMVTYNTA